jgi:transposase-like protein
MDKVAIKKHMQPWQQILAFITRTQAPHNWTSPKYGMTAQQHQKWRQLWQLASQAPGSPDPKGSWGSQAAVPRDLEDLEAWAMTTIKKACLEFCIELLNQRHRSHKYESVLVCTMAVLGQGEAS